MVMQVLILLACFSLGAFARNIEHEVTRCQPSEKGYYTPDPNDCQKYFICTSDGQSLEKSCAPQYYHVFDEKLGECRPLHEVTCGKRRLPEGVGQPDSIPDVDQLHRSSYSKISKVKDDLSWRGQANCVGQKDGVYNIPNQCKNFLTCQDGRGFVSLCAGNLIFDELINKPGYETCNYLENAKRTDCNDLRTTSAVAGNKDIESVEGYSDIEPWMNTLDCSALSDGKHLIPNHCGVYYFCLAGNNMGAQQCPVGTAFQNTHGFEGECFLGEDLSRTDCREKQYCEKKGAGNHFTRDNACDRYMYCTSNKSMAQLNHCPIDTVFEYISEHQGFGCVRKELRTRLECH